MRVVKKHVLGVAERKRVDSTVRLDVHFKEFKGIRYELPQDLRRFFNWRTWNYFGQRSKSPLMSALHITFPSPPIAIIVTFFYSQI